MKRIVIFFAALCLLLSMTACGAGQPGETTTTQDPVAAMAGKYSIYHFRAGETEMDYFQISMSTKMGKTYIELNADGTVTGNMMGSEILEGMTWDAETMTMTNHEGETNAFTLENNELKFEMGEGTMTLLKEGDPRLDDLPVPFEYLHDHIVANGTQGENGYTVICSEDGDGEKYTMTATSDGKIFWSHLTSDGVKDMEMELVRDAQFQTITVIYSDYTCTTTVETATITDSGFALSSCTIDPEPKFGASSIQGLVEMRVRLLFMKANRYLMLTVGINMASLGFTGYSVL